jgi:soluble lytic murein transglycosylase-like protein
MRRQKALLLASFFLLPSAVVGEAQADVVVFKNGRTMSVKSCRLEGETATMRLREGGEVHVPAAIVARIDPDEVPYPEEPAPVAEVAAVAAALKPALTPEEVLATRPYADLISTIAATHHVDARLVHAVIEQESNYQPRARSKKGARGLMQLMPDTARQYGVRNSYDPKANLEAGVRHLKDLLNRLELPIALAAYNAGEGAVRRYGGLPPFPETQAYVRNILRRVGS